MTIHLDKVHNFRDYGGYPVAGGGRLKSGLLYRSGHPGSASEQDRVTISGLDLRTIVDMRGTSERERYPADWLHEPARTVIAFDGETRNDPIGRREEPSDVTIDQVVKRKREVYRKMTDNRAMLSVWRDYMQALATRPGASLAHCFAGEGRTGLAVALLQHAIGVSEEDIAREYFKTNRADTYQFLQTQVSKRVRARHPNIDDKTLMATMQIHPSYLEAAFDTIRDRHGSVDAFLETQLKVDDTLRQQLRDRLVENESV